VVDIVKHRYSHFAISPLIMVPGLFAPCRSGEAGP
jgi:hypothetical protein